MNNLFDVLEICLAELEQGGDLEAILMRYPENAVELRPILQAATAAKAEVIPGPSARILSRTQAKFLRRFDQLVETQHAPRKSFPILQRWAFAFVFFLIFFFSGFNLVRASASALPGDGLYPIKRSWENVQLSLMFDLHSREKLEMEYERKRVQEINQLFVLGRDVHVEFVGLALLHTTKEWQVADISVLVSAKTHLPAEAIHDGDLVRVVGVTSGGASVVLAEQIELLRAGIPVPTASATQPTSATPKPGNENQSATEVLDQSDFETKTPTSIPTLEIFTGTLVSMDQDIWKIGDTLVDVSNAEIEGTPIIGAAVNAIGFFDAGDVFVASKLEIINSSDVVNSNTNSNANTGAVGNTNTDSNKNNANDNSGSGKGGSNDNGGGNGNGN